MTYETLTTTTATATELSNSKVRAQAAADLISQELRKASRRARALRPVTSGGGGFQERRSDRFFRRLTLFSFAVIFLIPSVVGLLYYQLIANDQFISEARFTVRSGESSLNLTGITGLASSLIDTGQSRDALIVADFIKSQALVDELSNMFDLRHLFSAPAFDFVGRLGSDASEEELTKYWKGQVDVSVDRLSGLLSLKIRAFSPSDSLALTNAIVSISERLVNNLTRRNELDAVDETRLEMERAKDALGESVTALRDERNRAGIITAEVAEKSLNDILTNLRLEMSKKEQKRATLIDVNAGKSPEVRVLDTEIDVLERQIMQYEARIAGANTEMGSKQSANLATQVASLKQAELHVDVARKQYQTAVASYEMARLTAERQRSYLLTYVKPRLAEESLYPRRGLMSAAISASAFLMWATFIGLAFVVRDNMVK